MGAGFGSLAERSGVMGLVLGGGGGGMVLRVKLKKR